MTPFPSTPGRPRFANLDTTEVEVDVSITIEDQSTVTPQANLPVVLLGDVQFALINYFEGDKRRIASTFAQHPLIGGKPRLQWVGDELDEITWDIQWHAANCDPEAEYQKILKLIADHTAQPLFTAAGDYKGTFVVQSFTATTRWTTPEGTLLMLDGTIALREYVEPIEAMAQTASQSPTAAQQAAPTGSLDPPGTAAVTPAPRDPSDPITRNS